MSRNISLAVVRLEITVICLTFVLYAMHFIENYKFTAVKIFIYKENTIATNCYRLSSSSQYSRLLLEILIRINFYQKYHKNLCSLSFNRDQYYFFIYYNFFKAKNKYNRYEIKRNFLKYHRGFYATELKFKVETRLFCSSFTEVQIIFLIYSIFFYT